MTSYPAAPFSSSQDYFTTLIEGLSGEPTAQMDAAALESHVHTHGQELMRRLMQDHFALRAIREAQTIAPMQGADEQLRSEVRTSSRQLGTLFGEVTITRKALVKRGLPGQLHPLDAALNLPRNLYSFGVVRWLAHEIAQSSYTTSLDHLHRTCATAIARRQAEDLVQNMVQDVEDFYLEQPTIPAAPEALLVLSFDGSGIVMRPEALREETRKRAQRSRRRSTAETSATCGQRSVRKNRKRMAQVATLYDLCAQPRLPEDILGDLRGAETTKPRPRAFNKRVWASLKRSVPDVIDEAFVCAGLRDPDHLRRWVALLDGNEHQLDTVLEMAANAGADLTVVIDLIHVLGYLWKAGKALVGPKPDAIDAWVEERSLRLLRGEARGVAAGMRRAATAQALTESARAAVDDCADYLLKYQKYLQYDVYLREGLPIATGVIEGACRSLVKDRMDITGARWGLDGGEAVLQVRSLRASGDLDAYLAFHAHCEQQRNHLAKFGEGELIELRTAQHRWPQPPQPTNQDQDPPSTDVQPQQKAA